MIITRFLCVASFFYCHDYLAAVIIVFIVQLYWCIEFPGYYLRTLPPVSVSQLYLFRDRLSVYPIYYISVSGQIYAICEERPKVCVINCWHSEGVTKSWCWWRYITPTGGFILIENILSRSIDEVCRSLFFYFIFLVTESDVVSSIPTLCLFEYFHCWPGRLRMPGNAGGGRSPESRYSFYYDYFGF